MSDPTPPPRPPRPPLSLGRRIAAAIGVIIMVLTGGCTVFIGVPFIMTYGLSLSAALSDREVILFGIIPFGFGLVIFLLAVRAGRSLELSGLPAAAPVEAGEYKLGDPGMTDPAATIVGHRLWKGRPVHELSNGTLEAFTDGRWQRFKDWAELRTTLD